jgi:glycosyltransferase involved in cell wall biosynthesis
MKIYLVLSNFPDKDGEAIEVVSYEVMRLLCAAGNQVYVHALIRDSRNDFHAQKEAKIRAELKNETAIEILPAIFLDDQATNGGRWRKRLEYIATAIRSLPLLRRLPNAALFPAMRAKPELEAAVHERQADIILGIWSWEALAATYAIRGVPKFMYYGNPDHKPMEARLRYPELFDIPVRGIKYTVNLMLLKMINKARELQHLNMMRNCEVTANNSLVDAEYYRNAGHQNSLYIQNMWPEPNIRPLFGGRCNEGGCAKIVGSVGNLGATGNTFGLTFLGERLAPRLGQMFGRNGIQIDIYGQGKPGKAVAPSLDQPNIRLRGWVQDIATEIEDSCAFLVLTNVSGFIVGNTRILLAWSLGSCVIAHTDSALSMPEIRHMENALLGSSLDEIASLIERIVKDRELRERIGKGGYETYRKYYRSEVVVPVMLERMKECVIGYRHGSRPLG